MARNLVYQYYYDFHGSDSHIDVGFKYYMLSKNSMEAYADKVGAEYIFIDKKIDIMKVFESEIGDHPFPRSERNIKALATYRGASSNCNYAESFMLLKEIR